jgi:hypothetical protein
MIEKAITTELNPRHSDLAFSRAATALCHSPTPNSFWRAASKHRLFLTLKSGTDGSLLKAIHLSSRSSPFRDSTSFRNFS